jgi:pimeloyl-ACP methyl ester carboxylesterase
LTEPRIEVLRAGSGETQVLLIHGSGSAAKPILRLGELIVAEIPSAEAHAVGLAGYGSIASDPNLPIIEQHLEVLQRVVGTQRWHLVGHSMGGFLALQLARRAPQQFASLSLIEPVAFGVLDPGEDRDALEADREIIRRFAAGREQGSGLSCFIEAWNQSSWESLPEVLQVHLLSMESLIYEEASAVSFDQTSRSDYAQLQQPMLLLAGTRSLLPAQRIVARLSELPSVTGLHWIEGAGHMAVLRNPQRFAGLIAEHIKAANAG